MRNVYIPSFTSDELNSAAARNKVSTRDRLKIEKEEMSSAIDHYDGVYDSGDAIFLMVRKDLGGGNFQYGIMITPLNEDLQIHVSNFKNLPHISVKEK